MFYSVFVEGINIVLSLFLLLASVIAVKKGVRIIRYMALAFAIIFTSSFISILYVFTIGPSYFGSIIVPEIALFLIMIVFYVGVLKGS
ncbi:MAG: hypothetical protein ACYDAO_03600 [Thermoplasmataceae archaeon]